MEFENTHVYNMKEAIRAARYSYGSERLSDTTDDGGFAEIGKNDRALIERLVKAGSSHRKFLRAILLTVDITAPRYWWTQFDTYKVGVTAISESTMHTLKKKMITLFDFSSVIPGDWLILLNEFREAANNDADFQALVGMLPQGYLQKRHVAMNYEVVRNIIAQRRGHKLAEWREFIEWAQGLPQADLFFGDLMKGDKR